MDESAISASHLVLVTAFSHTPAGEGISLDDNGLIHDLS
jgi:formyltetrahydrofolate synthetase